MIWYHSNFPGYLLMAFQNPLYASHFTSNLPPSWNTLPFGGYGGDPDGYIIVGINNISLRHFSSMDTNHQRFPLVSLILGHLEVIRVVSTTTIPA